MKARGFIAPSFDDLPGVPRDGKWVEQVLESRDKQIKHLTEILQGKASAPDNLNWEPRVLSVRHLVPVTLELTKITGKPLGAILIASSEKATLIASPTDVGKITLTVDFDSAPTEFRQVTALIIGP